MELPIQLKFFKKIELYQELVFEDKKKKDSGTRLQSWDIEKQILRWTRTKHHHLGSPLGSADINRRILNGEHSHEHINAMASLIQRGYAKKGPTTTDVIHPTDILITREGLLMGEVIDDINNGFGYRYYLFHWTVWITVFSGILIVIITLLEKVWLIIRFILSCWFIYSIR